MKNKKTVFITGATGNMGNATMKELLKRTDKFRIRTLVLNTSKERKKCASWKGNPDVEIVFGNMVSKTDIARCVKGADFVLHIGALVSPMADDDPKGCMRINYGSTLNIIDAIKQQPNSDDIALVYIGTVGETGCRMMPIHWGRCGDPIKPSIFDYYSVSKVASERAVIESGLTKWVSLRQTGILPFNSNSQSDPILFHQNLNNVLEWVTAKESGQLMANICEDWIPDSFWRNVYNIGGGEKWRFTLAEFTDRYFSPYDLCVKDIFDPRDMALFNFHGQWYTDSDKLNDITHFRHMDPDDFFQRHNKRIRKAIINKFMKRFLNQKKIFRNVLKKMKSAKRGPEWMIENNKDHWIKAFFGSPEKKRAIKSWEEGYELIQPSKTPTLLNHGYDESKATEALSLSDMKQAASFRGGKCLSEDMNPGELYRPLKWECHDHHLFEATPYLILKAGHWCPVCEKQSWNFAEIAKHNPFFAQVWTPLHDQEDAVCVEKIVNEDML